MLKSFYLQKKSSEVCIKARSTPSSLLFKGLVTEHTTVKWSTASCKLSILAKFPHSPILHYACRPLLTGDKNKNNATVVGLCDVFVVFWWRDKGLHTLNRMHNEVWGCAEI